MNHEAERWQRIREVFDAVVDLPREERGARIVELCGGDAWLRAEVERLLEADELEGAAFERPALLAMQDAEDDSAYLEWVGRRVGAYRLVRLIGQGGMGVVFEAERADASFEKRVAVKVIRPGMDTAGIVSRFQRERRILAALEHPNIATLIDGGATEDGRPFLVMEYVDGEPISRYCDARGLSIEARVDLIRTVCDAVAYAHRKLVVHRDLKPANILVTADGRVKLLDFGVAKLLADSGIEETVTVLAAARPLTPSYAAPEQFMGEEVTTSTDVYGLGAVLYELLCGRRLRELSGTSPHELARAAEAEPARPGAVVSADAAAARGEANAERLANRLSGDLDHIALMALRREPERRYASPDHLAADLRRWREGLPVTARPDTAGYRLRKFVRRNRTRVAAALVVFLTLLAGIVSTSWQARRASAQAAIAQQQAEAAELARRTSDRINEFLQSMLGAADPSWYTPGEQVGPNTTIEEVLRSATERVGAQLAGEPAVEAAVRHTIGNTWRTLGRTETAEEQLRASVELYRRSPPQSGYAMALYHLGITVHARGRFDEAESLLREAIGVFERTGHQPEVMYIGAINDLGIILQEAGKPDEAEPFILRALDMMRAMDDPPASLAITLGNVGLLRYKAGDLVEARRFMEEGLAVYATYGREFIERSIDLMNLALIETEEQHHDSAAALVEAGGRIIIDELGEQHFAAGLYHYRMAQVHFFAGNYRLGEEHGRRAVEIMRAAGGEDVPDFVRGVAAHALNLSMLGRAAEAERMVRAALAVRRKADLPSDWRIGELDHALAIALEQQGRIAEVGPVLEEGYRFYRDGWGPRHPRTMDMARRAVAHFERMGDAGKAAEYRAIVTQ